MIQWQQLPFVYKRLWSNGVAILGLKIFMDQMT